MTKLDELARELRVSGRSLRRAAARGTIRCARPTERKFEITPAETAYARGHWHLLSGMLAVLRSQPNVRLAVLFGSAARGEARPGSDLDLLVRFAAPSLRALAVLTERLEAATERAVQVVALESAERSGLLLADALRDGRVLVDRDGDWSRLKRRERVIARRAVVESEQLSRDVSRALQELEV